MFRAKDEDKPFGYPLTHQSFIDIPWKNKNLGLGTNDVMKFNGKVSSIPTTTATVPKTVFKRKSELNDHLPPKQLITEEKMCSFLRGIHLDENFKDHSINLGANEMDVSYNVNLSLKELEERLKNAQTISFHESVKKSLENQNLPEILPKVLFSTNREKPCQALMIYEPPKLLKNLIANDSCLKKQNEQKEETENCEKMMIE